jgi:glycosyltransferase involved in cell wall biosynthesis
LYVSASHLEGLPVSVLEAMAAGLPVVATDVGDVAQVVVEGVGVIVPARQPELLATAVNALLDNPAQMQMFGALARTHVLANYSQTIWMDRLLALYSEMKR